MTAIPLPTLPSPALAALSAVAMGIAIGLWLAPASPAKAPEPPPIEAPRGPQATGLVGLAVPQAEPAPSGLSDAKLLDLQTEVARAATGIGFERYSTTLSPEGERAVATIAKAIEGAAVALTVVGHTDSRGDPKQNLSISEQRARAVADLLARSGITAPVSAKGVGDAKPIADNDSAEGRARNRRIEILVERATS